MGAQVNEMASCWLWCHVLHVRVSKLNINLRRLRLGQDRTVDGHYSCGSPTEVEEGREAWLLQTSFVHCTTRGPEKA